MDANMTNTDNDPSKSDLSMTDPLTLTQWWRFPVDTLMQNGSIPLTGYDLDNEVHPIFAKQHFVDTRYEPLVPALRLASKLITTESLLPFWHTNFFCEPTFLAYPAGSGWEEYEYGAFFPPKRPLNPEEIERTQAALIDLSKHVKFCGSMLSAKPQAYGDLGERERAGVQAVAVFRTKEDYPDDYINEDPEWEGCKTDIYFSGDDYRRLLDLYAEHSGHAYPPEMLQCYALFASNLVHELAHACNHSRFGPGETFHMADRVVAESGYDWEESVFGGLLTASSTLTEGPEESICLTDWPDYAKVVNYVFKNAPVSICGRPPTEVKVVWRIPSTWALQLFQKSFWDGVDLKGAEAFKPPKLLGYRFYTHCQAPNCCEDLVIDFNNVPELYKQGRAPRKPGCTLLSPNDWLPHPTDEFKPFYGCPSDHDLLADGTLVPRKYRDTMPVPRILGRRKNNLGQDVLELSDGTICVDFWYNGTSKDAKPRFDELDESVETEVSPERATKKQKAI